MDTGTSQRAVAVHRRRRAVVVAAICAVLSMAPGAATVASSGTGDDTSASTGGTVPPVTANEFVPEDRELSDCISALPKPDCGSEARGGWRQGLVLAIVIAGMVGIAARVAVGIRRRDRELAARVAERERSVSPDR